MTVEGVAPAAGDGHGAERPYTLVAELTYRCPLRCVYCSNPVDYGLHRDRLTTGDWLRVFREAEALGALQLHLSGGEPLLRDDLEALVRGGHDAGLYVNLISSGLPLDRARLAALRDAGLDAFQLSIQDADPAASDRIAGRPSYAHKRVVAGWVKTLGLPLTLNIVLHRENLDRVGAMVAMAESLGVDRLELANTQYLAWALLNRDALLPSRAQLDAARATVAAARARLAGRMEILFVLPDYHADHPRACMGGWGRSTLVVTPDGLALPCHLAHTLPGLVFDNVLDGPLADLWWRSPGFQAFRGEAWMPAPCAGCDRRHVDFGGCRCQAFHLAGDAAATDPACVLSPRHDLVRVPRAAAEISVPAGLPALRYRSGRTAGRRPPLPPRSP